MYYKRPENLEVTGVFVLRQGLRFSRIKTGFPNTFTHRLSPVIHHIPLQSETAASKFPKLCVQCITTSISRPFFILLYACRSSWVYLPVVELGAVTFPCRVVQHCSHEGLPQLKEELDSRGNPHFSATVQTIGFASSIDPRLVSIESRLSNSLRDIRSFGR